MSTFEPATILAILKNSTPIKDKKDCDARWKTAVSEDFNLGLSAAWEQASLLLLSNSSGKHILWSMSDFCAKFAQGYPTPWSTIHPTIISAHWKTTCYAHHSATDHVPQASKYCTPILPPWSQQVSAVWFKWCTLGWVDNQWPQRLAWCLRRGNSEKGVWASMATTVQRAHFALRQQIQSSVFTANIPYFFKRCSVTHELFDIIVELRPSLTSMGIAENIKHTKSYLSDEIVSWYLQSFAGRWVSAFRVQALTKFSGPYDVDRYADNSITDDVITDRYVPVLQTWDGSSHPTCRKMSIYW